MNNKYVIWGTATAILALIVHICTVLAIPYLTENDAWERIKKITRSNQMLVVSKLDQANKLWAFHSPDMKYAICRYDITRGPVQVDFNLLRGYWSVALYNKEGKNFYTADGFDLLRERTSLLLLGPDHSNPSDDILPVHVPSAEGLVVVRASVDNKIIEPTIIKTLNRSKCEQLIIKEKP